MEIKDITASVERLDEVRGGQHISVDNIGLQVGANSALSRASGLGVGNVTSSAVTQVVPQAFSQTTMIDATEIKSYETSIVGSMVGFPYLTL
jgi:hypothetical protein